MTQDHRQNILHVFGSGVDTELFDQTGHHLHQDHLQPSFKSTEKMTKDLLMISMMASFKFFLVVVPY